MTTVIDARINRLELLMTPRRDGMRWLGRWTAQRLL